MYVIELIIKTYHVCLRISGSKKGRQLLQVGGQMVTQNCIMKFNTASTSPHEYACKGQSSYLMEYDYGQTNPGH